MDIVMQTVYICRHMNLCRMTYDLTVYTTVDIKSLHTPVFIFISYFSENKSLWFSVVL